MSAPSPQRLISARGRNRVEQLDGLPRPSPWVSMRGGAFQNRLTPNRCRAGERHNGPANMVGEPRDLAAAHRKLAGRVSENGERTDLPITSRGARWQLTDCV